MDRISRAGFGLLLIATLGVCAFAADAPEIGAVDLSPTLSALAASPGTGMVAAIDPGSSQVSGYAKLAEGDATATVQQTIGNSPVALVHKQLGASGVFIVACAGDQSIYVLDDDSLKVRTKLQMPSALTCLAAAADPTVPWCYYVMESAGRSGPTIGRIDAAALKDEGPITIRGSDADDIAVSADGTMIYGRRLHTSPSGVFVFRMEASVAGQPLQARQLLYQHESTPLFVTDPANQLVSRGRALLSPDFSRSIAELSGAPAFFLPDHPVLLTVDGDQLTAVSTNTMRELGSVPLTAGAGSARAPRAALPPRSARSRRSGAAGMAGQYLLAYDQKHSVILAYRAGHTAIIPLAALKIGSEPSLFFSVAGDTTLIAGRPAALQLTTAGSGAKLSLHDAPPGMRLENNRLAWTPPPEAIGPVSVKVNVSAAELTRTQEIDLNVCRESVPLPFDMSETAVCADGKSAVILAPIAAPENMNGQPVPGTRLALIDLEQMKVVATRSLPVNVRSVALGPYGVYTAAQDSDAIFMLSTHDLSDVKRVFTRGRVLALAVAGSSVYASTQGGPVSSYSAKALAPDAPVEVSNQPYFGSQQPLPVHIGNGWYYQGALYDSEMSHVTQVLRADGFASIPGAGSPGRGFDPSGRAPISDWNIMLNGTQLVRLSGQMVGTLTGQSSVILPDYPAVATLERANENQQQSDTNREKWEIKLFDVVSATAGDPIVLSDEPRAQGERGYSSRGPAGSIYAVAGKIVAVVHERMYAVATRDTAATKFPAPLQLLPPQEIPVVKITESATIAFAAHGGVAPLQYALAAECPGITIDGNKGSVTISGASLRDQAIQAILNQSPQRQMGFATTGPSASPSARDAVETYARAQSARLAKLIGRDVDGIPVAVPIGVAVRDGEQQAAALEVAAFLVVPRDSVTAAIAARDATADAERQRIIRLQEEQQRAMAARTGAVSNDQVQALQRQIADLERKNQDLEAQNKLLRELLNDHKGNGK